MTQARGKKNARGAGKAPPSGSGGGVVLPTAEETADNRSPEEKRQIFAEVQAGLRCQGCEHRLTLGLEFVRASASFELGAEGAGVRVSKETAYACLRPGCDEAATLSETATAVRPMRFGAGWVFLDDERALEKIAAQSRGEEVAA